MCAAPKPARRVPFPFNRDAKRRHGMIGVGPTGGPPEYAGGVARFYELDAHGLASLIEADFIDPHEAHNAAPTGWDILRFLCRHPQVRAAGYVVSPDRPDYRTSLDTVYAPDIDPGLATAARAFCVDAETAQDEHLECFWD